MQNKNIENDIKVSVIMPVYNVENYLKRAIDSVLNQTLEQIELFLVDDGSTDNSGNICDEYKTKDNRVHIIHKKNEGAHMARNDCLNLAKGEYLCFFDSDDYVEKNMLSDMYEISKKNDLTLLISGFFIDTYYTNEKYVTLDYIPNKEIFYNDRLAFRKDAYEFFDKNMFYSPWNKLYKREYILSNNITFPKTYRDDFPFVVEVIKDIDKVGFIKNQYYHFMRQRKESETAKYTEKLYDKRVEEHEMMLNLYMHWGLLTDTNSLEMISRRYIDRLIECIVNLYNENCDLDNNEKRKLIKQYINNEYTKISLKNSKPKSLYLKIMYIPIKIKNIFLIVLMAKFIHFSKKHFAKIFSILKTNR